MSDVTLQAIYEARRAIAGVACRTPLVPAYALGGDDRDIRLKLETAQPTGAFKLRGAAAAVARLSPEALRRGVTCASTGNHGRAVAFAARRMGGRAVVCMSRLVPRNKLDAIRALGAETRIVGESQDEAQVEVARLVAEEANLD
jgi:threonine dehydratase